MARSTISVVGASWRSGALAFLEDVKKDKAADDELRVLTLLNGLEGSCLPSLISALQDEAKLERIFLVHESEPHPDEIPIVRRKILLHFVPLATVPRFLKKEAPDAVIVHCTEVTSGGGALVEPVALGLSVMAQHFDVPIYLVTTTTALQGRCKSPQSDGKELLPSAMLRAVITEKGRLNGSRRQSDVTACSGDGDDAPSVDFSEFVALSVDSVVAYIKQQPALANKVGPVDAEWTCREIGDGNINYIYVVQGPSGSLAIKQALPYIRVVGESWPLTRDRMRIEAMWLEEQHKIIPQHVPCIHAFDPTLSITVMEYLAPPFRTLRAAILDGEVYPKVGAHMAEFLARSLFFTSALALKSNAYRAKIIQFHNPELCATGEEVIFAHPYYGAPTNAYLKPELEEVVRTLYKDTAAKVAIGRLRSLFMSKQEALIHSDCHTGSVMVTQDSTYVFDAEFAFYGPMAFDVGKFIGNLLLTYFALDGHTSIPRSAQQQWLLDTAAQVWEGFRQRFLELWNQNPGLGDAYPAPLITNPTDALYAIQEDFMARLFGEVVGFAAACMIRRLVTIAQIPDYTTIQDRELRKQCATRALKLARSLLVDEKERFPDIHSIIQEAEQVRRA